MLGSIKARLTAATVAIAIAAILLATLMSYRVVRSTMLEQLARELDQQGHSQAEQIAAWVKSQKSIVAALRPVLDQADPNPALKQALESGRLDLAYVGAADKRMVSVPDRQRPADYDPTARPWYRLASGSEAPVITAPYIAASSKKLVVTFAAAIRSGSELRGVVGSDVALDDVVQTLGRIKPTPNGFALLAGKDDKIIAHPDARYVLKSMAELSPQLTPQLLAAAGGGKGQLEELQVGERRFFINVTPVEGTDWLLLSAADRDEALASLSTLLGNAGLVLVLVGLGAVVASTALVKALLGRLGQVRDAMDQIGSAGGGDLTQRLDEQGRDELTDIARAFNRFVGQIESVMRGVRSSAESIAVASREIAVGAQDLSGRTEQTASSLEQTASAMEQLTETVNHNANAARQAQSQSDAAAQVAQRGGTAVGQVVATMDEISASSRRIADIIGTIDGIAFQTNILALNAAVEAARAGEQGRGFAVVAAEVRSLAQRSAEAAREIKTLIGSSVDSVEAGSRQVSEAGQTVTEIVGSVGGVATVIGEISEGAMAQSRSIGEINQAIAQLDQMTQQNAALVEESAAAAESLKDQAARLSEVVATFRIGASAA
jgi:methyl-accepting chemotaxis protein